MLLDDPNITPEYFIAIFISIRGVKTCFYSNGLISKCRSFSEKVFKNIVTDDLMI